MKAATLKPQPAVDVQAMGIRELEAAVQAGTLAPEFVLGVLDGRIVKRQQAGKSPVARVIQYRNELARKLDPSGKRFFTIPEPVYPKASAPANDSNALPTDPEKLADLVFSTIGAVGSAKLIAALTAHIAKGPQAK